MSDSPQILVTNDDGIHAPGIRALATAMRELGDVVMVAPDNEKSAVGHAITIADPIRIQKITNSDQIPGYAVKGTPADCVKIAVQSLLDSPPDIIISGINAGANVGNNVIYSGTVSAATEGTMLKIPSMAISLDCIKVTPDNFSTAQMIAKQMVRSLLRYSLPDGTLLNVNVPHLAESQIRGIRVTRQGDVFYRDYFEKREDPRGRLYYWMTGDMVDPTDDPDTDSQALADGWVSVSPIHYQLTNMDFLDELKSWSFGA